MTVSYLLYGLVGVFLTVAGLYFHHQEKAQKNK
jgi:hypothetical protein